MMDSLLRMNADELNASLIDFIKANFKGKNIAVHIYEDESDETAYLLSDVTHREKLLKSIEEVKHNKGLKTYKLEEIQGLLNEPEVRGSWF